MPTPAAHQIILIGGGGHALVVADVARACGVQLAGAHDDDPGCVLCRRGRATHRGTLEQLPAASGWEWSRRWILALGDIQRRRLCLGRLNPAHAETLVHPSACVGPSAVVGGGVLVGPGVVVNADARVEPHAILNSACVVEHECEVGENSHVAPGAVLGGRVRVGRDTLVGLGSRVLPGVTIGDRVVVGAGAVVVRDVPDGARVRGVPAR